MSFSYTAFMRMIRYRYRIHIRCGRIQKNARFALFVVGASPAQLVLYLAVSERRLGRRRRRPMPGGANASDYFDASSSDRLLRAFGRPGVFLREYHRAAVGRVS